MRHMAFAALIMFFILKKKKSVKIILIPVSNKSVKNLG